MTTDADKAAASWVLKRFMSCYPEGWMAEQLVVMCEYRDMSPRCNWLDEMIDGLSEERVTFDELEARAREVLDDESPPSPKIINLGDALKRSVTALEAEASADLTSEWKHRPDEEAR